MDEHESIIKIAENENEVVTLADSYHDEAVRERLKSLRSAGFSDEAVAARLKNYRYRYFAGKTHFAYAGKDYVRECKLMLDAYTALAEERGIII